MKKGIKRIEYTCKRSACFVWIVGGRVVGGVWMCLNNYMAKYPSAIQRIQRERGAHSFSYNFYKYNWTFAYIFKRIIFLCDRRRHSWAFYVYVCFFFVFALVDLGLCSRILLRAWIISGGHKCAWTVRECAQHLFWLHIQSIVTQCDSRFFTVIKWTEIHCPVYGGGGGGGGGNDVHTHFRFSARLEKKE